MCQWWRLKLKSSRDVDIPFLLLRLRLGAMVSVKGWKVYEGVCWPQWLDALCRVRVLLYL